MLLKKIFKEQPILIKDNGGHLVGTNGEEIKIEERNHDEVRYINGQQIAPKDVKVYNPAFDVTPPELITAIITNKGIIRPIYRDTIPEFIKPDQSKEA